LDWFNQGETHRKKRSNASIDLHKLYDHLVRHAQRDSIQKQAQVQLDDHPSRFKAKRPFASMSDVVPRARELTLRYSGF
jgi:hypothetical protein